MIDYNKIWEELNNDGEGFAVGDVDEDVNNIEGLRDYELIKKAETDNDVAVYVKGSQVIIVGWSNGPWAVCFVTYTCTCCGTEIVSKNTVWLNGEPFCKACMEVGI